MTEKDIVKYVGDYLGKGSPEYAGLIKGALQMTISDIHSRGFMSWLNVTSGVTTSDGQQYYELERNVEKIHRVYYTRSGKKYSLEPRTPDQLESIFDGRDLDQSSSNMSFYSLYKYDDENTKQMRLLYIPSDVYRVTYEYQKSFESSRSVSQIPERWHGVIVSGTIAAVKNGYPAGDPIYETALANQTQFDNKSGVKITRIQNVGHNISGGERTLFPKRDWM